MVVEREGRERLYLVVETKSELPGLGLRGREVLKIDCGRAHFEAIGADRSNPAQYHVARSLDEVLASATEAPRSMS